MTIQITIRKLVSIWILLFVSTTGFGQSKKVKCQVQVSGYAESLRLAYLDATNKAFYELIAQCGQGVKVSATSIDEVTSSATQYEANSYESMLVGLEGLVSNFEVLDTSKNSIEGGRYIRVSMTAKADIHLDSTRTRTLSINGLNPFYREDSLLTFTVSSDKDVYLQIYQVEGETATLFFPNKYITDLFIKANKSIMFPPSHDPPIKMRAKLNDKFMSTEIQNLVFVATKRKYHWKTTMSLDELIERYSAEKGPKDIKIVKVAITQ
tara:strand:+ start:888 stop:1685 length:798 start_codon:yes stop_codon:yes gene_type:complete